MQRSISFLKIPSFPISVERVVAKNLRGRPAVLVQSDSPRTRCLCVSTEASEYGLKHGMRLYEARRLCRGVSVLLPNPLLYKRASQAVQKIVADFSPLVEPARLGQSFLDLTGVRRLFGGAVSATEQIKNRILNDLRLPVDAGIAGNKLVSRVAALDANPMRLIEVEWGSEIPFLAPHRVSVLPAITREIHTQLIELNIQRVEQIRTVDSDMLLMAVGPVALALSRQARGIDPDPVTPPDTPPQILIQEELTDDTNDRELLSVLLRGLVIEGVHRLRSKENSTKRIMLTLSYSDGRRSTRMRRLRRSTDSISTLVAIAEELLISAQTRRIRIHHIDLLFQELTKTIRQRRLWNDDDRSGSISSLNDRTYPSRRFDKALSALLAINNRYGASTLKLGAAA